MKATFICIAATCLSLLSGAAAAQGPSNAGAVDADARFREGLALGKQGKPEEARIKFLQSYALDARPSVLLSLAIVEQQLGRSVDAIRHLRGYLQSPQAARADELKSTMLRTLESETGHVRVKSPPGVELSLDGARATEHVFAGVLDVAAGHHTLAAAAETRDVTVTPGQTVDVDLSPRTTAAPPDYRPADDRAKTWGTGQYLGAGAAVAGLVAVGLGVYFVVATGNSQDRIDALEARTGPGGAVCPSAAPQCQDLTNQRSEHDRNGALAVGFLVGGGVTLAAGIVSFLVLPKSDPARTSTLTGSFLRQRSGGFELRF